MALSNAPRPGSPVRGSETGRPIMATFDLLGRRWVLRIVGELGEQRLRFNEVQRRLEGISSSVLTTRFRELLALGIAEVDDAGAYGLTELGRSLLLALEPLWEWSDAWATATHAEPNAPIPQGLIDALAPKPSRTTH